MFRRRLAVAAVAALAILLPAAGAQAYPAPTVTVTVSDTTPTVGVPFTVSATDLGDATEATLTITSEDASIPDSAIEIAGTQAVTKPVTDGTVAFEVTLNEPGAYTLVLTTDTGISVTQVVTAVEAGDAGGAAGGGSGSGGGGLANTGIETLPFIGLAAALLLIGTLAVVGVRRARTR